MIHVSTPIHAHFILLLNLLQHGGVLGVGDRLGGRRVGRAATEEERNGGGGRGEEGGGLRTGLCEMESLFHERWRAFLLILSLSLLLLTTIDLHPGVEEELSGRGGVRGG